MIWNPDNALPPAIAADEAAAPSTAENPGRLHHCLGCERETRHLHLHDLAHGQPGTHMAGSERFQCEACGETTWPHSTGAHRFTFVLDAVRL